MNAPESWSVDVVSDFRHPSISVSVRSLIEHFESDAARALAPLRNFHHETQVDERARRRAQPAAVLIPIVPRDAGLTVLLTRRHHSISYPGHYCFPGGRRDLEDGSAEATALREAQEEIALDPSRARVLGRLGDYVTHSGYRIAPVVALLAPPLDLVPREGEVEAIVEIPLACIFRSESYRLARHSPASRSAHFFLEHRGAIVSGPTVSLLMGFYEELLKTHRPADRRNP